MIGLIRYNSLLLIAIIGFILIMVGQGIRMTGYWLMGKVGKRRKP